jgi:hypothetical protein
VKPGDGIRLFKTGLIRGVHDGAQYHGMKGTPGAVIAMESHQYTGCAVVWLKANDGDPHSEYHVPYEMLELDSTLVPIPAAPELDVKN